ncbi:MAG: hypothetical protein JWN14_79 [Chthonomonadales bacterium]|nr:hypothetical protein [Chthonomonadales bacterium]
MLSHLCTCAEPLVLHRDGKPVHWHDETLHRAAFASDPELYSLSACVEAIQPWQQARILFLLLTATRRDLDRTLVAQMERITLFLLTTLASDLVLTVFLAARRARANHRHTSRAILTFFIHHPDIEALACARSRVIRDCLEHALGKVQARYFGYYAPRAGVEAPLPALLKRSGGVEAHIRGLFASLYFGGECKETPVFVPAPVAAPHGGLVLLLQQFYRVGTSPELVREMEAAIGHRAAELPSLPGRIALILDASASMRGPKKQEFAPIALAVAFERVMQAKCPDLRAYTVGGFGWPPAPEGPTDFGRMLIDALEGEPDVVVFVTDSYENQNAGDAARILATLRKLGISTPIVCCRIETDPRGTKLDAASGNGLVAIPIRTERDFGVVLQILDLLAAPQTARARVIDGLLVRQKRWEQEVLGWIAAS